MYQKQYKSMKKNEISPLYAFMSSARLSIALSTAIVLVLTLSLFYGNPNKDDSPKTNTASSNKTNVNVVNVANSSFI